MFQTFLRSGFIKKTFFLFGGVDFWCSIQFGERKFHPSRLENDGTHTHTGVARFFVVQHTKTEKIYQPPKIIPKGHTIYRNRKNIPNPYKLYQKAIQYTETGKNILNDHKLHQQATKYTKWP
jgi:hypothetical protein